MRQALILKKTGSSCVIDGPLNPVDANGIFKGMILSPPEGVDLIEMWTSSGGRVKHRWLTKKTEEKVKAVKVAEPEKETAVEPLNEPLNEPKAEQEQTFRKNKKRKG